MPGTEEKPTKEEPIVGAGPPSSVGKASKGEPPIPPELQAPAMPPRMQGPPGGPQLPPGMMNALAYSGKLYIEIKDGKVQGVHAIPKGLKLGMVLDMLTKQAPAWVLTRDL